MNPILNSIAKSLVDEPAAWIAIAISIAALGHSIFGQRKMKFQQEELNDQKISELNKADVRVKLNKDDRGVVDSLSLENIGKSSARNVRLQVSPDLSIIDVITFYELIPYPELLPREVIILKLSSIIRRKETAIEVTVNWEDNTGDNETTRSLRVPKIPVESHQLFQPLF